MSLYDVMKQISVSATEEGNPTALMYGTVTSASPLSINVEQKFELDSDFLILTKSVTDYETLVTMEWETETQDGHKHLIKGTKKVLIHNGLSVGDRVVLLRMQGGQKFLVIDKVGG